MLLEHVLVFGPVFVHRLQAVGQEARADDRDISNAYHSGINNVCMFVEYLRVQASRLFRRLRV